MTKPSPLFKKINGIEYHFIGTTSIEAMPYHRAIAKDLKKKGIIENYRIRKILLKDKFSKIKFYRAEILVKAKKRPDWNKIY